MQINLDKIDKKILLLLEQDASISNLELSKAVGLSPSACLARTKNLIEKGVIRRFTTLLDEKKLGFEITAFITINLAPYNQKNIEIFISRVKELPYILECYTLMGSKDYLLKAVAPNIEVYKKNVIDALVSIPGISSMETSIVVSTEKRELMIPIYNT
ncbi:MAG: Lrp/AsnC family transcriptional regulator [Caldicoprobacterales bacterium]|nr:Lrp/AsnC family transcriptional regulator [Clostridiales bacterium]